MMSTETTKAARSGDATIVQDPLTETMSHFRRSRFMRAVRNNPFAIFGIFIAIMFLLIASFPGLFTEYDPIKISPRDRLLSPSSEHLFGTDELGMDIYTRVIYGARTTLKAIIVVLAIAFGVGSVMGSVAGYLGGWFDNVVMRITDIFIGFPPLILALAVNAVLGRGFTQTVAAVALTWWPSYARLIRAQILTVKNEQYVMAARAAGVRPAGILVRHVLRNSIDPIIVSITLDVGYIALATAALSFVGLGAAHPTPEWGRMVAQGRDYLLVQWWYSTYPGMALFLLVVSFNLFGELLRDWLDPSAIRKI
jgi:peptide/nickel transport system permease protein